MSNIAYIRVSSSGQNTDRQEFTGIQIDKTFTDKCSGSTTNRPQLSKLLEFARENDHIYVYSMDRLARNSLDLATLVKDLNDKGIKITFIKESLTFAGNDSPMSQMLLGIMGAIAQFERAIIKERQSEGIAKAKANGKALGRPSALTPEQISELNKMVAERYKKTDIAEKFGISRKSVYTYINS